MFSLAQLLFSILFTAVFTSSIWSMIFLSHIPWVIAPAFVILGVSTILLIASIIIWFIDHWKVKK